MTTTTKVVIGLLGAGAIAIVAVIAAAGAGVAVVASNPQFQQQVTAAVQNAQQEAKVVARVSRDPDAAWMLSDPEFQAWYARQHKDLATQGLDDDAEKAAMEKRGIALWKGIFRLSDRDIRKRVSLVCMMAAAADPDTCAEIAHTNYSQQSKHLSLLNDEQQKQWVEITKHIIHSEIADDPDPIEINDDAVGTLL
jgi:hypothetical protein